MKGDGASDLSLKAAYGTRGRSVRDVPLTDPAGDAAKLVAVWVVVQWKAK